MLKSQITLVPEVVRSIRVAHHYHILDANAELPVGVVPGFYATFRMYSIERDSTNHQTQSYPT